MSVDLRQPAIARLAPSWLGHRRARAFAVGLLVFVLLAAAGTVRYFHVRSYERNLERSVGDQLTAIADLKSNELATWRKERINDATMASKLPGLSALVQRLRTDPSDVGVRDSVVGWMQMVRQQNDYQDVLLLDPDGQLRLTASGTLPALSPELRRTAGEAIRTGQITIGELRRDSVSGQPTMEIAAPIGSGTDDSAAGRATGVVCLVVDPVRFLYPFIQFWPTPSPTAETL